MIKIGSNFVDIVYKCRAAMFADHCFKAKTVGLGLGHGRLFDIGNSNFFFLKSQLFKSKVESNSAPNIDKALLLATDNT